MDNSNQYLYESKTSYQMGINYQREAFKAAKHNNDFDSMADSLENIKSDIKTKLVKTGRSKIIIRIEKILTWYRTKETKYLKRTEEGLELQLPADISYKANKNLTIAYELLVGELERLELL